MRKKDKTKKFTSPTFFPSLLHYFHFQLLPRLPPRDDWENEDCSQCITALLDCSFLLILFSCSSMWPLPWDGPSQNVPAWALPTGYNPSGTDCSSRGPPQIIPPTKSLLQRGLSTGCRAIPVAFTHSFLTVVAQYFLSFLKYILTEVPAAPLWAQLWPALGLPGPALSGCVQHGTSPGPFSERPLQQYLLLPKPWHLHPTHLQPNT